MKGVCNRIYDQLTPGILLTFSMLLLLSIIAGAPVSAATPTPVSSVSTVVKKVVVTGTYVNVRSGPGTNYSIAGKAYKGQTYDLVSTSGQWVKIKLPGNKFGWLANWLVTVSNSTTTTNGSNDPTKNNGAVSTNSVNSTNQAISYALIKSGVVNVRSGAGTQFSIVLKAKAGQKFKILGSQKDWYRVDLGAGKTGWVANWVVAVEKSAPAQSANVQENTTKPNPTTTPNTTTNNPGNPLGTTVPGLDMMSGTVVEKQLITTKSGINLRNGPGVNYSVLSTVGQGVYLSVYRGTTDWYLVQPAIGQKGWIAAWLTKEVPEPAEQPAEAGKFEVLVSGTEKAPVIDICGVEGAYQSVPDAEGYWYKLILPEMTVDEEQVVPVNLGSVDRYEVKSLYDGSRGLELTFFFKEKLSCNVSAQAQGTALRLNFPQGNLLGKVIAIDPGHGGYDPGAVGKGGLYEKNVALDIANKLAEELRKAGATVILTRDEDVFIALKTRADIANENDADIFVSLHANASVKATVAGSSTYYYAPASIPALAAQGNERKGLAQAVQSQMVKALGTRDIGILQENFAVTRLTQMPSILVETAFISNPAEEKLLADAQFRSKIAIAINQGILDYFNSEISSKDKQ